ncbi:keratin-associated protein 9-1-like [Dendronephthya gigantea]|uniref:keratin-associated protein 9-1-like n=1 Tax=Dendronephthya gigantea TaxID=151771 RepID=UPI00106D24E7|nr:keratin-associated protein 9-1-like [Dendronephthya gigantea]
MERKANVNHNFRSIYLGCRNHHECHNGQSCCKNKGIQEGNFCATRCFDAACLIDSDCDRYSKCCHDNKCVSCASLECSSNSQCSDGYCCDRGSHRTSRCFRSGCVGESCDSRSDCGGPNECCIENKCVKCPKSGCRDNWECPAGKYCCKGEGQGLCSQSCVGKFCRSNKACSAPGECCINHECTALNCTCRSKYDCRNGFHCCRSSGNQGYCRPNCTGMKCKLENDCSPAEICTYPDRDCVLNPSTRKCSDVRKCFSREGCFSHNDCNSFGSGYYCCRDTMFFSRRSCYSNCINKICTNDSDCGGAGECCDSKKKRCLDCPKTPNDFPVLAILFIVVGVLVLIGLISWYVRCKVCRPRNTLQRSTEPSPTAQQEIQATPSWSTETENGNGQFNVRNTDDRIYENDIGLPSAPPMELYENPSTLNLPPPPSYESLFPNR